MNVGWYARSRMEIFTEIEHGIQISKKQEWNRLKHWKQRITQSVFQTSAFSQGSLGFLRNLNTLYMSLRNKISLVVNIMWVEARRRVKKRIMTVCRMLNIWLNRQTNGRWSLIKVWSIHFGNWMEWKQWHSPKGTRVNRLRGILSIINVLGLNLYKTMFRLQLQ